MKNIFKNSKLFRRLGVGNNIMFFITFFLAILSNEKEINITEYFIGEWHVLHTLLDGNAVHVKTPDRYLFNVVASGDDFIGTLSGEEKTEFQPTQVKIIKKEDLVYSILISDGQDNFKELCPPLTFTKGVDDLIQAFGHIDSRVTFSVHFITNFEIEITLHNNEDGSISFYHLGKPLPPTKPPISGLQLLLPLIPIFIMMYNREKSRQEQIQNKKRLNMQARKAGSSVKKD